MISVDSCKICKKNEETTKAPERGERAKAVGRWIKGCLYCYDEIVMSTVR